MSGGEALPIRRAHRRPMFALVLEHDHARGELRGMQALQRAF